MPDLKCLTCGSDDVELLPAEYDDESDVVRCYECHTDREVKINGRR